MGVFQENTTIFLAFFLISMTVPTGTAKGQEVRRLFPARFFHPRSFGWLQGPGELRQPPFRNSEPQRPTHYPDWNHPLRKPLTRRSNPEKTGACQGNPWQAPNPAFLPLPNR